MQADTGVVGDGLQHMTHHGTGEVTADEVVNESLGLALVHQVGASGDVDDGMSQGLVQRNAGLAEAADAALVTQGCAQGLTDADGGVLHGVVHVDLGVTGGAHRDVDEGVTPQSGEHVVVEGDSGGDVGLARAVEVDLDDDAGLTRGSLDARGTAHVCFLSIVCRAFSAVLVPRCINR